tara:strand:- start:23 stop:175 length:153 start_codon:yes stop_codon:yes gene_type:complete
MFYPPDSGTNLEAVQARPVLSVTVTVTDIPGTDSKRVTVVYCVLMLIENI